MSDKPPVEKNRIEGTLHIQVTEINTKAQLEQYFTDRGMGSPEQSSPSLDKEPEA
jgi:hypothetical protein